MSAWKEPAKKKILIAKNGKKARSVICKGMLSVVRVFGTKGRLN